MSPPTTARMSWMSSAVAPPVEKPVEVFHEIGAGVFLRLPQPRIFSLVLSRAGLENHFANRAAAVAGVGNAGEYRLRRLRARPDFQGPPR